VENFERSWRCANAVAQGYVFAPPLPGPSFLQLLEAIDPQPVDKPLQPFRYISARQRALA
jgi:hypothetical protein